METVGANKQVEASLAPVPQLHIDAIALLPSGDDFLPKHIGHELRTGGEEGPREIVSEELYVVAVKAATAQGALGRSLELVVMFVADGHTSEMGSAGAHFLD